MLSIMFTQFSKLINSFGKLYPHCLIHLLFFFSQGTSRFWLIWYHKLYFALHTLPTFAYKKLPCSSSFHNSTDVNGLIKSFSEKLLKVNANNKQKFHTNQSNTMRWNIISIFFTCQPRSESLKILLLADVNPYYYYYSCKIMVINRTFFFNFICNVQRELYNTILTE